VLLGEKNSPQDPRVIIVQAKLRSAKGLIFAGRGFEGRAKANYPGAQVADIIAEIHIGRLTGLADEKWVSKPKRKTKFKKAVRTSHSQSAKRANSRLPANYQQDQRFSPAPSENFGHSAARSTPRNTRARAALALRLTAWTAKSRETRAAGKCRSCRPTPGLFHDNSAGFI